MATFSCEIVFGKFFKSSFRGHVRFIEPLMRGANRSGIGGWLYQPKHFGLCILLLLAHFVRNAAPRSGELNFPVDGEE